MNSKLTPELFGDLVRDEIPDEDFPSLAARHRFVESRRPAEPRFPAQRGWTLAAGLLSAAALATAVVFWMARPAPELTFQVVQNPGLGSEVHTVMAFSDGSSVKLLKQARARVERTVAHGADLVLQGGKIHVSVVPNPANQWTVTAGPIRVAVTGTQFDVGWDEADRVFVLELLRGAVVVTSPLGQVPVRMTAGQRLSIDLDAQQQLLSQSVDAPVLPITPAVSAHPAAELTSLPQEDVAAPVTAVKSASRASAPSWKSLVVQGDFQTVLAEVRGRGVDDCLSRCELSDLEAAAEAARYSGELSLADRLLQGLGARFPNTTAGLKASFLLGDVAQRRTDPASAGRWYRRYLEQSPRGRYAAEAVGRLLVMTTEPDMQRPLAERYLELEPKGAYSDRARRVLAR